jgi:hypothetical protein
MIGIGPAGGKFLGSFSAEKKFAHESLTGAESWNTASMTLRAFTASVAPRKCLFCMTVVKTDNFNRLFSLASWSDAAIRAASTGAFFVAVTAFDVATAAHVVATAAQIAAIAASHSADMVKSSPFSIFVRVHLLKIQIFLHLVCDYLLTNCDVERSP